MSRIGRSPITLPKGVTIDIQDGVATVKGPKGTVTAPVPESVSVENGDGVLTLTRASESTQHKSLHGLTRALLNNAVVGVSEGFTRVWNCAAWAIAPKRHPGAQHGAWLFASGESRFA
jgi:large subunit ribosomal protein L6